MKNKVNPQRHVAAWNVMKNIGIWTVYDQTGEEICTVPIRENAERDAHILGASADMLAAIENYFAGGGSPESVSEMREAMLKAKNMI